VTPARPPACSRLTYIGTDDPTDSAVCEVFGFSFELNQPVEMDNVPAKLRTNRTFVVEGDPLDHDGDGRKGGSTPRADDGTLASLTVPALKALATERGVDLGDATKKADVIAALELAAEAAAADAEAQLQAEA
jgi:hypothetical protein